MIARGSLLMLSTVIIDVIAEYVLHSEELDRLRHILNFPDIDGYMYQCVSVPLLQDETETDRRWFGIRRSYNNSNAPIKYSIQFVDTDHYYKIIGCAHISLLELLPSQELKKINGSSWDESSWDGCGESLLRGKDIFLSKLIKSMDAL